MSGAHGGPEEDAGSPGTVALNNCEPPCDTGAEN